MPDLAGLTGYAGVTSFKQLAGCAGGAYAITYSSTNFESAIGFAMPTNLITYLTNVEGFV